MTTNPADAHVWIVGDGMAGLAAAAFLVRDVGLPGDHIHVLGSSADAGGDLDAERTGFVTRGDGMLAEETHRCLWNLLETVPDRDDPTMSVREAVVRFNERVPTHARARLVDYERTVLDASAYGFDLRDRVELTRLLAVPEHALGARRIDEMFSEHFFETRFWTLWSSTFRFRAWHSAAELRRYVVRFLHEFARLDTLAGMRTTVYDQHDSIVVPLQDWLRKFGVDLRAGATATDADFQGGRRRAVRLHYRERGDARTVALGEHDHLLMTIGSTTADCTYGGADAAPEVVRDRRDGSWAFWETIARKAPDFGRPNTFYGDIDENACESFTLTMHGRALLDRLIALTGNEPGTGGITTFVDSAWQLSIVVPHQPHFPDQPAGSSTLWGYGLSMDTVGDHVGKTLAHATGTEILTELVGQFGCRDILDDVLATTDVTTALLPYALAPFSRRVPADRPKVIPDHAENFAFLGQFAELGEDVAGTMEYSVRGAMHAVYHLFGVERPMPPVYHGLLDPQVGIKVLESLFR